VNDPLTARRFTMSRADALCLVAILALTTIFLAPALRPGYTLLPLGLEAGIAPWNKQVYQRAKNNLLSDPFYIFYPHRHFLTASLRQGNYPLWNPYIFSGHPMVGDANAQTFYPPNLVAALFVSAARALPLLAWFHLNLTGFSMFAFLRLLRLRPGPALFGAVAWMLNGNMVVWLENSYRLSTLAWMPAVFLFYELALQRHRIWPGMVAGLLYGLAILGGHTQFALGIGIALAAYALFRAAILSWKTRRLKWYPLAIVALVGLLGVGIGAIALLPTFQLAGMSRREIMSLAGFVSTHWPLQHVIGLWIPDFYGNPVRFAYWGQFNYAEVTAYHGAFAIPLALVALVWATRAEGRFFIAGLLAVVLITLGTPVAWLVAWLPWARYFRLVSLVAYIPFFGGAAGAFGLEVILGADRRQKAILATLALVLVILVAVTALVAVNEWKDLSTRMMDVYPHLVRTGLIWLIGTACLLLAGRRPAWAAACLVILLAVDLLQWGMPFNPVNSLDILYPENPVTDWLRQDAGLYRVLPLQSGRIVFGPNVLSVFGFQDPDGYSSQVLRRYRDLGKAIQDQVDVWWMAPNGNMLVHSKFDPSFSMLNVKYVLSSYQRPEEITVETSPGGCLASIPLRQGELLTQEFRVSNPGLNRIDLHFTAAGTPNRATLRFRLWRDRIDGELVADIPFEATGISETGEKVFFFAPVSDSMGGTFVWGVQIAGGETGPALCRADDGQGFSFTAYSTQLRFADTIQGVWIYENPNVLPRAYISHHVEAMTDEEALRRIRSKEFDPWHSVLITSVLPPELQALTETPSLSPMSPANVVEYSPQRVTIDVQTASPGILVLSDTWYPGWYATVDGQDVEILQVNYALRGVYVDRGVHQVEFRFRPPSLYVGAAISFGALFAAALIMWLDGRFGEHQEQRLCRYLSLG
jgi:hypothetical protein